MNLFFFIRVVISMSRSVDHVTHGPQPQNIHTPGGGGVWVVERDRSTKPKVKENDDAHN